MVIEHPSEPVREEASVTVKLGDVVCATVGVPVIAPVEELRLRLVGRAPDVIDHVYGVVPPVAVMVNE